MSSHCGASKKHGQPRYCELLPACGGAGYEKQALSGGQLWPATSCRCETCCVNCCSMMNSRSSRDGLETNASGNDQTALSGYSVQSIVTVGVARRWYFTPRRK